MKLSIASALVFIVSLFSCLNQKENSSRTHFVFNGRCEILSTTKAHLIGSASSVSFAFKGKECLFSLQSIDSWEHYNFYVLEVDGTYKGRFKVEKGKAQLFSVKEVKDRLHNVTIYKATEAANGSLLFDGSVVKNLVVSSTPEKKKKIEFIGNSITCGMGNDLSIPCNTGEWFDQHNAYWAYGPILSRKLNADFLLSSVSGIGMYRNWNDEHIDEAIMPDVYENLYLNKTNPKPFDTQFQPDLVSICLGTNDLSEGDGVKKRLPFNEEKYVSNYINFIQTIYKRYPNTKIVLLNSPMVSGENNTILIRCLNQVIDAFTTSKTISLFEFPAMEPKGCDYHPNIEDHKKIAQLLENKFTQLLHE